LAKYRDRSNLRGIVEITVTAGPLAVLWGTGTLAASVHCGFALIFAVPAAGFLVRLFMLQHDCGHGSLFANRRANDWAGRIMGVFTLTPYDCWRSTHNQHHAGSGNLDRRGIGDITTLTAREYIAKGRWRRLHYRLYRHPLVLLGAGPSFLFMIQHRWPGASERRKRSAWISTMTTNAAILVLFGSLWASVGTGPFLAVHVPVTVIAATVGVWLFYVQHQFETTYWEKSTAWAPDEAALTGCSYLVLPPPLRWLTANIGMHHIHHLSSGIPFYRLPSVLEDWPELEHDVRRLGICEGLRSLRLTLWDEASQRLIGFHQLSSSPAFDWRGSPRSSASGRAQGVPSTDDTHRFKAESKLREMDASRRGSRASRHLEQ
jgi:omega-6 fatty acid desaturase (delta-12 desaturase)